MNDSLPLSVSAFPRSFRFLFVTLLAFSLFGGSRVSGGELVLPDPLPEHPRLLATPEDWSRLREQVRTDPVSAEIFASVEEQANAALTAPLPVMKRLGTRGRMLSVSRSVLGRTLSLSLVYRITGKREYAERAVAEMLAVCDFESWNPHHFLDVAEMALAVAIGYDWLYDELIPPQRERIARALREKAIEPSFGKHWWISGRNNWTQVCHAGLSAAAIAIADSQPRLATEVLNRAIVNVARCGESYAPDGVFPEGPLYWDYATSFHVILAAELKRLGGDACGLDTLPGFEKTPVYLMQVTGPTGDYFNYSDATASPHVGVPLFWFARHFRNPGWAGLSARRIAHAQPLRRRKERLLGLALLWHDPDLAREAARNPEAGKPPRIWLGRGSNPVAVFRSGWDDPAALYLGIKGGGPSHSHAHMDGGSFVLEADGVRWAVDPGLQDYRSIEDHGIKLFKMDQKSARWTLFRFGPEAHNIMRFNGAQQLVKGDGRFVRFEEKGKRPHAVLDLTPLYSDRIAAAHRGVMLVENRAVLFQDEWKAGSAPVEGGWQMLTDADVTVNPREIVLTRKDQTLTLQVLAPADARIDARSVAGLQGPIDADNPGLKRITIRTRTEAGESGSLRVFAVPGSAGTVAAPPARPVLEWSRENKRLKSNID